MDEETYQRDIKAYRERKKRIVSGDTLEESPLDTDLKGYTGKEVLLTRKSIRTFPKKRELDQVVIEEIAFLAEKNVMVSLDRKEAWSLEIFFEKNYLAEIGDTLHQPWVGNGKAAILLFADSLAYKNDGNDKPLLWADMGVKSGTIQYLCSEKRIDSCYVSPLFGEENPFHSKKFGESAIFCGAMILG